MRHSNAFLSCLLAAILLALFTCLGRSPKPPSRRWRWCIRARLLHTCHCQISFASALSDPPRVCGTPGCPSSSSRAGVVCSLGGLWLRRQAGKAMFAFFLGLSHVAPGLFYMLVVADRHLGPSRFRRYLWAACTLERGRPFLCCADKCVERDRRVVQHLSAFVIIESCPDATSPGLRCRMRALQRIIPVLGGGGGVLARSASNYPIS